MRCVQYTVVIVQFTAFANTVSDDMFNHKYGVVLFRNAKSVQQGQYIIKHCSLTLLMMKYPNT